MCETYTVGGDMLHLLDPVTLIGQTFSPLQEHKIEFIDLNLKRITIGGEVSITLHDLTDDPDMVGGGISRSKYATWPRRMFWELSRVRFSMSKRTLKVGKNYGILIHHDRTPWWNYYHLEYDINDATYPRGKRFTKDSLLDPPTYYENDDLIFTEFGTPVAPPTPPNPDPVPPPTPPDPPINNWIIIQLAQERTETGEKIIAYTNVPCHLWMRWTLIEPRIHRVPITRRGLTTMNDLYFCFDVYTDNEQQQEGDTLIHTFIKEPWPYCQKRWFYFHGEVNGVPSPSTTGVFFKHPIKPPELFMFEAHESPLLERVGLSKDKPHFQTFTPRDDYVITKLELPLTRLNEDVVGIFHVELYPDQDYPPTGEPAWSGEMNITNMPIWPEWAWFSWDIPSVQVHLDVPSSIKSWSTDWLWSFIYPYIMADTNNEYPRGKYCADELIDHGFRTWGFLK